MVCNGAVWAAAAAEGCGSADDGHCVIVCNGAVWAAAAAEGSGSADDGHCVMVCKGAVWAAAAAEGSGSADDGHCVLVCKGAVWAAAEGCCSADDGPWWCGVDECKAAKGGGSDAAGCCGRSCVSSAGGCALVGGCTWLEGRRRKGTAWAEVWVCM